MKNKFKLLITLFIMAFAVNAMPQVPGYSLDIKNGVQVSPTRVTFDIVLTHTDANRFEYAGGQYFFKIPLTGYGTFTPGSGANSPFQYDSVGGHPVSEFPQQFWPRSPSAAISGDFLVLRLAANILPGFGNGLIIPQGESKLVMRMKLISSTPMTIPLGALTVKDSCTENPYTAPGTSINAYVGSVNTSITSCVNHHVYGTPALKYINLKYKLEAMYPVLDSVTINLRNAVSPYNIIDSKTIMSSLDGSHYSNLAGFINIGSGGSYYIEVAHRNSIATWSANPILFSSDTTVYDFTTSLSQAYGSNMINVAGTASFYSGDVNQDETVDASDLSQVENGVSLGLTGYIATDVNGDDIDDASDLSIVENNIAIGLVVLKP